MNDLTLTVKKGDKIAFVGSNNLAKTTLFQIITGEFAPDRGSFRWIQTITNAYFPKDNNALFDNGLTVIEWICQYSPPAEGVSFARGILGRMLFSGDERVRCMISRMMLNGANALIIDEPTNHLVLESFTSQNNALVAFPEVVLFASEFIATVANRIVEITPHGIIDRVMGLEE